MPTKKKKIGFVFIDQCVPRCRISRVGSVGNERANGFLTALLRHRETNKLKQIVQSLIDAG